jgi:hypothetical protein
MPPDLSLAVPLNDRGVSETWRTNLLYRVGGKTRRSDLVSWGGKAEEFPRDHWGRRRARRIEFGVRRTRHSALVGGSSDGSSSSEAGFLHCGGCALVVAESVVLDEPADET